jgi:hypothetical protein
MELVWADEKFVISGLPYQGFPILLWDSMDSCVPVNRFFRYYLLRGSIRSKKSWPSTGRALYDFFSFLQSHELDWCDVDYGGRLVTCLMLLGPTALNVRRTTSEICFESDISVGMPMAS